jgi:hypothetical protein
MALIMLQESVVELLPTATDRRVAAMEEVFPDVSGVKEVS